MAGRVGREQCRLLVRRKPVCGPQEDDRGPRRTAASCEHLAEVAISRDDHQIVGCGVVEDAAVRRRQQAHVTKMNSLEP